MRLRWRVRVKVKTYCVWKLFHKEAEVARTFPMGSYYLKKKYNAAFICGITASHRNYVVDFRKLRNAPLTSRTAPSRTVK